MLDSPASIRDPEMSPKEKVGDGDVENVDKNVDDDDVVDVDAETAELSRLRCTSVRTEEIADREKQKKERERRRNRCSDYPGLAFGSASFGSETMMKFNIIKNELHNIMRSQLRRVDGEVTALGQRIRDLDSNLELSEKYIKTSTAALAEAVAMEVERQKLCDDGSSEVDDSPLGRFDAQMALFEAKLMEARFLAAKAGGDEQNVNKNSEIRPVVVARPPAKKTELRRPFAQQKEQ